MSIRVQQADFDIGAELAALRQRHGVGALVSFSGIVRGRHPLELEHYQGMTEKSLAAIEDEAVARWDLVASLIIHRTGLLQPGEQIVLVAAASAHRQAAFEAASYMMDFLKSRAPFWKKEWRDGTAQWVSAQDSDEAALARWGEGA